MFYVLFIVLCAFVGAKWTLEFPLIEWMKYSVFPSKTLLPVSILLHESSQHLLCRVPLNCVMKVPFNANPSGWCPADTCQCESSQRLLWKMVLWNEGAVLRSPLLTLNCTELVCASSTVVLVTPTCAMVLLTLTWEVVLMSTLTCTTLPAILAKSTGVPFTLACVVECRLPLTCVTAVCASWIGVPELVLRMKGDPRCWPARLLPRNRSQIHVSLTKQTIWARQCCATSSRYKTYQRCKISCRYKSASQNKVQLQETMTTPNYKVGLQCREAECKPPARFTTC